MTQIAMNTLINKNYFYLLLLISVVTHAQDKTIHMDLEKYRTITESISLGESGIVLKTGFPIPSSVYPNRLFFYAANGELIWEKKIKGEVANGNDYMAASPNGDYIYFIEMKDYAGKSHYITQILKNGQEKLFPIEINEGFGKSLQSIFCDDQYLYYLATQNGDEISEKKKPAEKLILIRFNHSDLSYKRFLFDLPAVGEGEANSFWSFIGQDGTDKYLVSKSMDVDNSKGIFSIAVFNDEGVVTRKFKIDFGLTEKFVRPASNASVAPENIINTDYETKVSTSGAPNMGSTRTTRSVPTYAAFASIKLDKGNFYVFGLTGPKPYKKGGAEYDGFHLAKYDLTGLPVWKLQQPAAKELLEEGTFRVHGLPGDRDVAVNVMPNGHLNFFIQFNDKLFEYEVSAEGKIVGTRNREGVLDAIGKAFSVSEPLKSDQFIQKSLAGKKNSNVSYDTFLSTKSELVLRTNLKGGEFDLYYFNK